jgi:1D-myo-inositol 3-kinase
MKIRGQTNGPVEFIAVGHLAVDRLGDERALGGAAAYAAITSHRLGLRSGVITSLGEDFPFWEALAGISVFYSESERTTSFENTYEGDQRAQRIRSLARRIDATRFVSARPYLAEDAAILYCPIVHEVLPPFERLSPQGLLGVAPQGLFREWDETGKVSMLDWVEAQSSLAPTDFVCMSEDDAVAPEALAEDFPGKAFVVTKGARGCRVHSGGDVYDFPAVPAREVDVTGAGDVFAAAFLVSLRRGDALTAATRFASSAAAISVEGIGPESIPTLVAVEERLAS